jgi:hypothetical protein
MRSAPCASAPSHPLHAMPPRITRNSDRPRASDRTMVNIALLAASCTLEPCHPQQRKLTRWTTSRTSSEVTKPSGLDLEKEPRSSGRGGAFFLTSLFIELIDPSGPEGWRGSPISLSPRQCPSGSVLHCSGFRWGEPFTPSYWRPSESALPPLFGVPTSTSHSERRQRRF